jgi:hypothetical protein
MLGKLGTALAKLVNMVTPEAFGGRAIGHCPEMAAIFQDASRFEATNEDFVQTIGVLKADALRSIALFNKSPASQFWRRNVIKSIFAWLEGQTFVMKAVALERFAHFEIEFSTADLAMLREDKYTLDDKGEAKATSNNYQKFIPNYQFAFKCYAKAHAVVFQFDTRKLPQLRTLESVRNRLTHPKGATALQVADDEMHLAQEVLQWHLDQSGALLSACCQSNVQTVKAGFEKVTTKLRADMPVVLFWRDGSVFEFPTKRSARQFGKAKADGDTKRAYLVYSWKEILAAHGQ